MGRKILAVIVAWIAATATMMIIEMGNSTLFASPSEAVMKDPAALREYMANGPVAAYVVVLIGYAIASFVGGFIGMQTEKFLNHIDSRVADYVISAFIFLLTASSLWVVGAAISRYGYVLTSFLAFLVFALFLAMFLKVILDTVKGNGSNPNSHVLPLIVGITLSLLGITNFIMLPGQPFWFVGLALLTFIPLTLMGHTIAKPKKVISEAM